MVNFELYKKNKKYLIFVIIVIIISIINNMIINHIGFYAAELDDKTNNINKLVISEIMTSNKGVVVDANGNKYDWIELYNGYKEDIDLTEYGLSDEHNGRVKWLFPSVTIKSKSYLIIYLSGKQDNGLYANFSLSQEGGETITLKNNVGKVVDAIKTVNIEKNNSMARDLDGKWIVTKEVTPGYENSNLGRKEYLLNSAKKNEESSLIITEFLPCNEGNIIFDENKLYSYVELTNIGTKTVDLNDYYLSNDEYVIYKWRLPKKELKSGETYLIYMNGLNIQDNASFELKTKTGMLILSTHNQVLEKVKYENLTKGTAYIKKNGIWEQNANISPGYINDMNGITSFRKEIDIPKKEIIINEVMSSNNSYLPQNGNQFYDWIELYNNSNQDINLSEYFLTTDIDDQEMFNLPNIVLKPNSYYLIMASGDEKFSNGLYKHANFRLSSGKGLFLYKKHQLIDSMYIYNIPKESSYGRGEENGHYYYNRPTPGFKNDTNGIIRIIDSSMFSIEGGIYNNITDLELRLQGSNEIYYTLDGSVPNKNSNKYVEPIKLTKTTVVRAVSYDGNKQNSDIITNSYIVNENHTIPVVSLSMPEKNFNEIQAAPNDRITTKAHAELYEKDSYFSIDCDFKLFGGQSTTLPKKSFALKFNYQLLNYKIFDDKDIFEFKTVVLRSGSQEQNHSMMRDEFLTSIGSKYGKLDAQAYKPVVLYINGKYWGVYYLREKIEEEFIENNYNVLGPTNIISSAFIAKWGSNSDILKLRNYVNTHDLTKKENYDYASELLDIDNYLNYWVYQFIISKNDLHNLRYYNNKNIKNNKIRMLLYDLDHSLYEDYGSYYLSFMQNPTGMAYTLDNSILISLFKNQEFKNKFLDKISYYLKNVWTTENINKEFNLIYNAIEPEMKRNCERWSFSYDTWKNNTNKLKSNALKRSEQVIDATKKYFNLSQEDVNELFY